MSTPEFEAFLARLYTDRSFRERFLADRRGTACGLSPEQVESLVALDRDELELAARGFEKKRARRGVRSQHGEDDR